MNDSSNLSALVLHYRRSNKLIDTISLTDICSYRTNKESNHCLFKIATYAILRPTKLTRWHFHWCCMTSPLELLLRKAKQQRTESNNKLCGLQESS